MHSIRTLSLGLKKDERSGPPCTHPRGKQCDRHTTPRVRLRTFCTLISVNLAITFVNQAMNESESGPKNKGGQPVHYLDRRSIWHVLEVTTPQQKCDCISEFETERRHFIFTRITLTGHTAEFHS